MLLKSTRAAFKPFAYPWAFEFYQLASRQHWLPVDVSLEKDLRDWLTLPDSERNLLTQVQLYLANADTDIASNYTEKFLPLFPLPEIRMMLLAFAAMEAIHSESYAYTLDQLGFPETAYSKFLDVPQMYEKHCFITAERDEDLTSVQKTLLDIAINSIFGEGLQLFSAFAIILSFDQRGLMRGLCDLTQYIARDEDLHCKGMTRLFSVLAAENKSELTADLIELIAKAGTRSIELEDHFIDLAFELGDLPNLTASSLKEYIRYIANKRLAAVDFPLLYPEIETNPLPWTDLLFGASIKTNNFERTGIEYQKDNLSGSWENARQRRKELLRDSSFS
ncbi:MAG TPA: ribonucleotide-diphosphate reductase subunit beta [Oculatellaceae cyanobacterium]